MGSGVLCENKELEEETEEDCVIGLFSKGLGEFRCGSATLDTPANISIKHVLQLCRRREQNASCDEGSVIAEAAALSLQALLDHVNTSTEDAYFSLRCVGLEREAQMEGRVQTKVVYYYSGLWSFDVKVRKQMRLKIPGILSLSSPFTAFLVECAAF